MTKLTTQPRKWIHGQLAGGRRFIPNVPVVTQHGDSKMLYDDIVKDQCVLFQFTSIQQHGRYPVTRNLANVQRLLGDRCGRDVTLLTITTSPESDTPERFAEFASQFKPGAGWVFLSGAVNAIHAIKQVLFVQSAEFASRESTDGDSRGQFEPSEHGDSHDCSSGLMRYGNDAAGLWGSVPTKLDPELIVQRLSWIQPNPSSAIGLRRKGPVVPT